MRNLIESTTWETGIPLSEALCEPPFEAKAHPGPQQPPVTHPSMDTAMYAPSPMESLMYSPSPMEPLMYAPTFPSHMLMVGQPSQGHTMMQSDYNNMFAVKTHHREFGASTVDCKYKQGQHAEYDASTVNFKYKQEQQVTYGTSVVDCKYKQGQHLQQQASYSQSEPCYGDFFTSTYGPTTMVGQGVVGQPMQVNTGAGSSSLSQLGSWSLSQLGSWSLSQLTQRPGTLPLPMKAGTGILPGDHTIFVKDVQRDRILYRRASREKLPPVMRKEYLHESRHHHAKRRARGEGGRFLNTKNSKAKEEGESKSEDKAKAGSESESGEETTSLSEP